MPSAKRRDRNRGPVTIEVYNRHNTHAKETWADFKAKQFRDQRAQRQDTGSSWSSPLRNEE